MQYAKLNCNYTTYSNQLLKPENYEFQPESVILDTIQRKLGKTLKIYFVPYVKDYRYLIN